MAGKPTYRELQQRIKKLEAEVAERKRAEEKIKIYELMVESAHDAIFFKDLKSRYLIANVKALEVFGLSKEEVIGKNDYEIMANKEEAKKNVEDDQAVFKTGKPKKLTKQMTSMDGKEYWFQAIKVAQCDDKGNLVGLVGIARDITKRQQAEEAMRESERKYRDLVESIDEVIYSVNRNGVVTYINSAIKPILGYSPSEIIGKSFAQFIHEKDLPRMKKRFQEVLLGNTKPSEYRLLNKKGEIRWIRASSKPVSVGDGATELQGVIIDIDKSKRIERALREKEKKLEDQAQGLERVNTALNVLLEYRDNEKKELEVSIVTNVKKRIFPYIEKMDKSRLDVKNKTYLSAIKSNLMELTSPFASKLSSKYLDFTPTEIEVADHVMHGKTSKEIADLFNISLKAVSFHRNNIRKKLGLTNERINLRSYLQNMSS